MESKLSSTELTEKKHFDETAQKYDSNYQYSKPFTRYKIVKKSLDFANMIKRVDVAKDLKMVEIGCGTGEYTRQIATLFPESKIVGLDISDKILRIARRKCKGFNNVSFISKSAYKTGFKSNSFDVVYGFYVLHHMRIGELKREILRILRPGGFVFFYEPNILNPIVFLIKSNKYLKKRVGDSPNEWAINPITISKYLKDFNIINVSMSEFILPLSFIPAKFLIKADKISYRLRDCPLVKYLGGSVQIFLQKK